MVATQHPEFALEQEHLQKTVATLQAYIGGLYATEAGGADEHSSAVLRNEFDHFAQRLQWVLPSPYFGRIDFWHSDDDETTPYYIGKEGFECQGCRIVNWRAPLASLFYQGKAGQVRRTIGQGASLVEIAGSLLLKRHLKIENRQLQDVVDEFDIRHEPSTEAAPARVVEIIDPDEYLQRILKSRRGDVRMLDIVATIQAQQYELIHAPLEQILVIQGVAGSGKTSVALHRLAFLLYPDNNASNLQAERCIVFGPNRLFLHFIAQVLPELGVENLPQTTLEAWSCEQMGFSGRRCTDHVLEAIFSPDLKRDKKAQLYRQSQLKTSHRMGQMLQAYVEACRQAFSFPDTGLVYDRVGPLEVTLSLTSAQVTEAWQAHREQPLALHRERFFDTLRGLVAGQYDTAVIERARTMASRGERLLNGARRLRAQAEELETYASFAQKSSDPKLQTQQTATSIEIGRKGLLELANYCQEQGEPLVLRANRLRDDALEDKKRRQDLEQVARRLQKDIDRYWPALNIETDYYALLAHADQLGKAGGSVFKPQELELLGSSASQTKGEVDLSDLPALHYLHMLVTGIRVGLYDHIVIDEAQDVAPLQLETLRRYSRNQSLTILGDLAQSIYPHRGLSNWDEVKRAFPDGTLNYQEMNRSYRCTYEIMDFAHRVLNALGKTGRKYGLAEPFERHGEKPQIYSRHSFGEMADAVVQVVGQVEGAGYHNIAIIAKTNDRCGKLAMAMRQAGLDRFNVALSADFEYQGGIVVLPVHLAKGMEFDVALVVEADDKTYTDTEYDGRLLYVALTRGLHLLHVFAVGRLSTFLR